MCLVLVINDRDEFSKLLSEKAVVVDFWAEWCMPCQRIAPVFEEASKELKTIKFVKVNVDNNESIASELAIQSIPSLILFIDGEEKSRHIGTITKAEIKDWLDQYA
ncbi:thioredoxin [Candidatus Woesearchaeota archaeon]|nr:thioredoxin [Candidatus Woesearchaeota archaeon]